MTNPSARIGSLEDQSARRVDPRRQIMAAMIELVGTRGYLEVSVADVIEEANSSRATFYRYFEGRLDCFLAAYEVGIDDVLAEVTSRCDTDRPWVQRMTEGLRTVLERFARDPALARAALVEVGAAGPEGLKLYWRAMDMITERLDDGRELASGRSLPPNISLMVAGAVAGVIFDDVVAGRTAHLPARLPELVFAMLVPYLDRGGAEEEMRRVAAEA